MIRSGTKVSWKWGDSNVTGKVESVHHEQHQITSKGETISRNGTKDDPALVIKSDNGVRVIKLAHEVETDRTDD